MNILFITSTYLGDAVLSTGLLNEIIKAHPKASLTVACGTVPAPLLQTVPNLKKCLLIEKKKFSLHWIKLWCQVVFTKWDLVVDLRGTGISYFLWAKTKRIWRSSKTETLKGKQITAWYGLSKTPFNHIWTTPAHKQTANRMLPKGPTYVAFSPTANWDKKCWPLSYFTELGQALIQNKKQFPNLKILILGAPSQKKEVLTLLKELPEKNVINLVGAVSLPELAECLKKCTLFVGNDSGLMHLSAACSTPTLGIFGPSPVHIYRPWGPYTQTVHLNQPLQTTMKQVKEGQNVMARLSVKTVLQAINKLI